MAGQEKSAFKPNTKRRQKLNVTWCQEKTRLNPYNHHPNQKETQLQDKGVITGEGKSWGSFYTAQKQIPVN
jgi:hypothetical protein